MRNHISNHILFIGMIAVIMTPLHSFGFDVNSLLQRTKEAAVSLSNTATEAYYDVALFDDAPVRQHVNELKEVLRRAQASRIRRIERIRQTNRILALELEAEEAQKSGKCSNLGLENKLTSRIEINCQINETLAHCGATSNKVTQLVHGAKSRIATVTGDSPADKILAAELQISDILKQIETENSSCSEQYFDSLTQDSCKDTYEDFFAELRTNILGQCVESEVIDVLDSFVKNMRNLEFSTLAKMHQTTSLHVKARNIEVDLAKTLEKLDADRIKLEKALGQAKGKSREPASEKPQLENYLGS